MKNSTVSFFSIAALSFSSAFAVVIGCAPIELPPQNQPGEGEGEGEGDDGGGGAGDDVVGDDNNDFGGGDEGEGEGGAGEEGEEEGGEEGEEEAPVCGQSDVVDMPTSAACAASTRSCLNGCGGEDESCFESCLSADPGGDACIDCVDESFIACVNSAGCQAEWDAIGCCSTTCPNPEDEACFTSTCGTEANAYESCIENNGESCDGADAVCFP